ncbi:predicted protein [Sclerotinia sclerotiorum 1980 UF-70]|uniref:Uncharacterized protein n=1 Tax=Sclerotinia sclerotiorum (strain ATCC 18683 / 1980 / Ss-1) TaxID=665079 RepID=A7EZH7_SCLS1|nr:predicted protein [Sclerotinia sclerotiorum 1980 UF-70]EDN94869.1 predicted protein [Sclerotinia sclerotiorum 1980 UF-70]
MVQIILSMLNRERGRNEPLDPQPRAGLDLEVTFYFIYPFTFFSPEGVVVTTRAPSSLNLPFLLERSKERKKERKEE